METVTCANISVFKHALIRGKAYDVLQIDEEKQQVRIKTDNGRVRWFPMYCFVEGTQDLLKLIDFKVDDPIGNPYMDSVEVTITLGNKEGQQKRWCYFITPACLYKHFPTNSSEPLVLNNHGIIVPMLTTSSIEEALYYLETHNLLEICTLPMK